MRDTNLTIRRLLTSIITMVALIILKRSNIHLRTALLFQAHKMVYSYPDDPPKPQTKTFDFYTSLEVELVC